MRLQRQYIFTPCWSCVPAQVHTFIYRSYGAIYINFTDIQFHLISSEWWPSGENGGLVISRPCGVAGSNPTVVKIFFVMFTCSMFLAAGLAPFK